MPSLVKAAGLVAVGVIVGKVARMRNPRVRTERVQIENPSGIGYRLVDVPLIPERVKTPNDFLRLTDRNRAFGVHSNPFTQERL